MKISCLIVLFFSLNVNAIITSKPVIYKDGATELEGIVVYESKLIKSSQKLPAVMVIHDWMGVGEYVKMRAEQLAGLGYVAFVADIYGKGVRPKDAKEASEQAGKFKGGDRKNYRDRLTAAFEQMKKFPYVDSAKVSAIGYCFGGTGVLEMARMGLPLNGVVSFHGGLSAAKPNETQNIKTNVLVLHGAIDPYVNKEEVDTFLKEMNEAKVNYEFVAYSGAVHAFTEKHVGSDISKGAAYNEVADKRSFATMKEFLAEVSK